MSVKLIRATMIIAWFTILGGDLNSSFGYIPGGRSAYLGECGERLIEVKNARRRNEQNAEAVRALANDVIRKKQLMIPQAKVILGSYSWNEWVIQSPPNVNEFAIPEPVLSDTQAIPFDDADQAEIHRARFSYEEWDRIISLWAQMLNASSQRLKSMPADDYCGPVATIESLAWDSTRILWAPIWTSMFHQGWGGGENRPWVGKAVTMIAGTVPSLVTDAGLALPNSYLRARDMIRRDPGRSTKQFLDAIAEFISYIQNLDTKHMLRSNVENLRDIRSPIE